MKENDVNEIASSIGVKGNFEGEVTGYFIDSRKVSPGGLFFALKGAKSDGHDFLGDVSIKRAICAVVSESYQGPDYGLILLRVKDVLETLQDLARKKMQRRPITTVAVTGSVGKTTTKEFIARLLEAKFTVAKTPGNANSQVGLPLAVLNLAGNEEVFVVEMGMSEKHQIEKLVSIAPPDIAVITKIGMAHIEYFEKVEGIAEAKAEILSHPRTRLGIVSAQAAAFGIVCKTGVCKKITYSIDSNADFTISNWLDKWFVEGREKSPAIQLSIRGNHIVEDFLAATVVARQLGVSWESIVKAARELKPFALRFEIFEKDQITYISDCYNASPDSMRSAIANMPKAKSPHRMIAVIGEMVELGSFSKSSHQEIAQLAFPVFDCLLCVGEKAKVMVDVFSSSGKMAEFCKNLEILRKRMEEILRPGDVVLVKGSNTNQLWKIFDEKPVEKLELKLE